MLASFTNHEMCIPLMQEYAQKATIALIKKFA